MSREASFIMVRVRVAERARLWDLAVLVSAACLIGGYSYFVSRHRLLWSDELFAWSLVTDASWGHMWRAWNLGADSGGPGFYVLCRLWLTIFGQSAIAFRAFSAAGVFAAFAALWFALRRYYRPGIVALALFTVFFGSPVILWQIVQTRFYGLLLGAAGWSLYAMLRSAQDESQGGAMLLFAFFANLLLINAHPLGLLYSGLLLFSALLNDAWAHRKRWLYYGAVVASWPVLVLSRTALHNLSRVGKPWFWTTTPTWNDLLGAYTPRLLVLVRRRYLPLLAFLALVILVRGYRRGHLAEGPRRRSAVLISAAVLLLAPAILWLLSQRGTSYFVDRYFLPYTFGVAILLAELLTAVLFESPGWKPPLPEILLAGLSAVLVVGISRRVLLPYPRQIIFPPKDFTVGLAAFLPRGEPIVIPKTDIFDEMAVYQSSPDRPILFPLDWELALDARSPRWLVSAEREMENAAMAGYYPGEVVKSSEMLRTLPRFAVVTDGTVPWLAVRVASQPGWRLEKLGEYRNGFWSNTIWQVDRTR